LLQKRPYQNGALLQKNHANVELPLRKRLHQSCDHRVAALQHFNTSTESEDILRLVRFLSLAFVRFLALSCCCYQVPFSHHVGELRAHYAGFFDPGFGFGTNGDIKGSIGVLEVLCVEVCV